MGNSGVSEVPKLIKTKPKPKPVPHYLTGTKASKAMQRPKSPMIKKLGGPTNNKSPSNARKPFVS